MTRAVLTNVAFWVVAATSVVVGLFLVGTERLLAAAIVWLSAGTCLAVIGFSKPSGPRAGHPASVSQQRRNGLAIMVTGMATIVVGAILTVVWPGPLATFLLFWATPGMTVGGAIVYWHARAQQPKNSEQQKTD